MSETVCRVFDAYQGALFTFEVLNDIGQLVAQKVLSVYDFYGANPLLCFQFRTVAPGSYSVQRVDCTSGFGIGPQFVLQPAVGMLGSVCDTYAFYGTACTAAYSTTRALYLGYGGPLYRVQRATDGATTDIGLLAAGGYANAATQDAFCNAPPSSSVPSPMCVITKIYDQSPHGNHLTVAGAGGAAGADRGADAQALPITAGGHEAYGVQITPGIGYRNNSTTGIPAGGQAEGMYMVASGTHDNSGCCFDFGNAETNALDNGNGHMDAVNLSTTCYFPPCTGPGPWVAADLENGLFQGGNGSNTANQGNSSNFVTALLKNDGQSTYAIKGGDATAGGLSTWWNGSLPTIGGYKPMHQESAVILGTGGDNSNWATGSFFEGVITAGYPSDAADNAVQANITSAGYAGNSAGNPPSNVLTGGGSGGSGGSGGGRATPLLSALDGSRQVWAKQGLNGPWVLEVGNTGPAPSGNMNAVATASDPTNGPLIAVIDSAGQVWAKKGLGGTWILEVGSSGPQPSGNMRAVAVASDPTHGPLIAVIDGSGQVWAKAGGLGAPWVLEVGNTGPAPSGNMNAVAVASDPTNGPLIAVIDGTGQVWAKQGSLSAAWAHETGNCGPAPCGGMRTVAVASDQTNGPLIAVIDLISGQVWAKQGSLNAAWVLEVGSCGPAPCGNTGGVSVASDPTTGPLIAVIDSAGQVWAKVGGLSAAWAHETGSCGPAPCGNITQVSVASDPAKGPTIAVIDPSGQMFAKQGPLGATWTAEILNHTSPPTGPIIWTATS